MPDAPKQFSAGGGVNSNLGDPADQPTEEMYPDPATHDDRPEVRDAAPPATQNTVEPPPPADGSTTAPPANQV